MFVERIKFGDESVLVFKRGIDVEIIEGEQIVIIDYEDRIEDDINGREFIKINKEDDRIVNVSGDDELLEDFYRDIENGYIEKKKDNF